MEILYTTDSIRKAIATIFRKASVRRVAVVAFVGEGAEAFLPNPKGLEVVCWAKAGGTSADCVRRLIRRGAKVSFAKLLHMKVYWAAGVGAVITSANLSTNALGSGNLQELGVRLPAEDVDIKRILRAVKPKRVTKKELERLDKDSRDIEIAIRKSQRKEPRIKQITYKEWFTDKNRREWRLGWWDDEGGAVAKAGNELSRQRFNESDPWDFICCSKKDYRAGDWLVKFCLGSDIPTRIVWGTLDFIVRVLRDDKKAYNQDYPYQAIQVNPKRDYPPPPFRIDSRFKEAFKKAINQYGAKRIKGLSTTRVPKEVLAKIYRYY